MAVTSETQAAGISPAGPRPARGDELELAVDALAFGGNGVARRDGYVVFVQGAVPGDRVRARVTKAKRGYAEARVTELLVPSPDRVPERCDHDGPCPGSPWQVLPYELQLQAKQDQVRDALERLGKLEGFELEPILPATDIWRYRNKMEYSFGEGGAGELVCGFHARGRWHQVDAARDCMLASEFSNAIRNWARDWCAERGLRSYDRRAEGGGEGPGARLRNLVVREGRRTGCAQVRLVTGPGDLEAGAFAADLCGRFPEVTGVLHTLNAGEAEVSYGPTELLAGSAYLEEEVGGLRFRISPDAFFQTNTEMAEQLYRLAGERAALRGSERVFDLFCGIGTVALVLSLRAGEVYGMDIVEEAIADAIANAKENEIDNVRFFAGDLRTGLRPLLQRAGRPDTVVLDPPRAGLSQKIVRRVLECGARRIVYVSCNPTTLAPNAKQMEEAGYRLVSVRPVDMFPHTPHIECVALLEHAA